MFAAIACSKSAGYSSTHHSISELGAERLRPPCPIGGSCVATRRDIADKVKRTSESIVEEMGIEAEIEAPDHGLQRTLKDLFAGAVGGVAQVLIGMWRLLLRLDLPSMPLFWYI